MDQIRYSVLMSVYYKERPEYLMESIRSILQQTVLPDEIVVVKDGPLTDELDSVLNEFNNNKLFKFISLAENVGLGKALNIGLKECSNELIARMDTDDIARVDRCEKQLNAFKNDKDLDILSSYIAEFSNNINEIDSIKKMPLNHKEIIKYSKKRNPFNHPVVMYKKSVVENAGGYKHFDLFEDYYLWVRVIMNGAKCGNIDEPLLYMRANNDMFKRRGGYKYLKCIIKFKWHLKKIGFYSLSNFIVSSLAQGLVAIIPNKLRIFIYKKFLRLN